MKNLYILIFVVLIVVLLVVFVYGDEEYVKFYKYDVFKVEVIDFGQEGNFKKVMCMIDVDMVDSMCFILVDFFIKCGEIVKFVVYNKG